MNLTEMLADALNMRKPSEKETWAEYLIDSWLMSMQQAGHDAQEAMKKLLGLAPIQLFEHPTEPYSFFIANLDGSAVKVALSSVSVDEMLKIAEENKK